MVRAPAGSGRAIGAAAASMALKSMAGIAMVSPRPALAAGAGAGAGDWIPAAGIGAVVVALGMVGGAPPLLAVGGTSDASGMVIASGGLGAGLAPHWLQNRAPSGSG